MNRIDKIMRCLSVVFLGSILFLNTTPSIGQELSDCNAVMDFEIDDTLLTRSEVIALMEELFYESLAEYQECLGGGSASQTQSGGGGGGGQNSSYIESVAVSGLQGTETPHTESESSENLDSPQANLIPLDNGSPPEDIPSGDNDNIVAAQIRLAAENETDPVEQAKLWNEYRRYKGLPLKEIPQSTAQ